MPVKSQPKERPIIEMLLSAYENDTWKGSSFDWVEEKQDGAVEVVATRADGKTLALEHTLIQPFVGEKFDSEAFIKAFGRIEKNPALVLPERNLDVIIPVYAIPKGYNWDEVGKDLLAWLVANHAGVPKDSQVKYTVPAGGNSRNGPLLLRVTLRTMSQPGRAGNCLIYRNYLIQRNEMPLGIETVVEKALRTKIPKLVNTVADKRILLLEREQTGLGDNQVYGEEAGPEVS